MTKNKQANSDPNMLAGSFVKELIEQYDSKRFFAEVGYSPAQVRAAIVLEESHDEENTLKKSEWVESYKLVKDFDVTTLNTEKSRKNMARYAGRVSNQTMSNLLSDVPNGRVVIKAFVVLEEPADEEGEDDLSMFDANSRLLVTTFAHIRYVWAYVFRLKPDTPKQERLRLQHMFNRHGTPENQENYKRFAYDDCVVEKLTKTLDIRHVAERWWVDRPETVISWVRCRLAAKHLSTVAPRPVHFSPDKPDKDAKPFTQQVLLAAYRVAFDPDSKALKECWKIMYDLAHKVKADTFVQYVTAATRTDEGSQVPPKQVLQALRKAKEDVTVVAEVLDPPSEEVSALLDGEEAGQASELFSKRRRSARANKPLYSDLSGGISNLRKNLKYVLAKKQGDIYQAIQDDSLARDALTGLNEVQKMIEQVIVKTKKARRSP